VIDFSSFNFFDDEDVIPQGKRVELKGYIPPVPRNYLYMTRAELEKHKGGVMFVDVESYPNYFLIGFKLWKHDKVVIFELSQDSPRFDHLLLSWILHNYTCVGFNINHYDLPMIWLAYLRQNTKYLEQVSTAIIENNMRRYEVEEQFSFKIVDTDTIDIFDVPKLKGSLKTFIARLHGERLQDLPFPPHTYLTKQEAEIVKDYNVSNDLYGTELLWDELQDEMNLRKALSAEYKVDLRSKSDAQIAEYIIAAEIERFTGQKPKKAKKDVGAIHKYKVPTWMRFETPQMQRVLNVVASADYIVMQSGKVLIPEEVKTLNIQIGNSTYRMGNGGLHSSEKETTHKATEDVRILDRDVASYYPNIVLTQKLTPENLGQDFLDVYTIIVKRRLEAKQKKDHVTAQALKITVNGAFGKLGSPYSVLYAPDLMIQVTVSGQLCLLMLIEMLELQGIEVISANTDGVVMKVGRSQDNIYKDTIARWEAITGFETEETEYTSVHSRDVNAYMAIKKPDKEGKVKAKGKNVFFNPWAGGKETAIFRLEKNPMATICTEAIERFIIDGIKVEDTIRACTDIRKFLCVKKVAGGGHKDGWYLGKVVRFYYAENMPGCINYVIGNKKVGESEGGKPCMELPTTFPSDVDYIRYIERANEMLSAMGYFQRLKDIAFF